jgi:dienelactone hydrolase
MGAGAAASDPTDTCKCGERRKGAHEEKKTIEATHVEYADGDQALKGYLAYDSAKADKKMPAVMIVPAWGGVSEYEYERARMIAADLGYVAMVADIYGNGVHYAMPTGMQDAMRESTKYRSDIPLFNSRMNAAVAELRKLDFVDSDKIAAIGYCFGGTGVINLAISGADISGIVSFHGGLTQRAAASKAASIPAKMLILSGGSDDAQSEVAELENELNMANATWEITRYYGVGHSFTEWGPAVSPGNRGYNPRADFRSWTSMGLFFEEIFSGKGSKGSVRTQQQCNCGRRRGGHEASMGAGAAASDPTDTCKCNEGMPSRPSIEPTASPAARAVPNVASPPSPPRTPSPNSVSAGSRCWSPAVLVAVVLVLLNIWQAC